MKQGYMSMVLHAHLPYVRHEAREHALEERWLFEALSETYLPLLAMWERLREQEVPFAFALTISPTLLTLLTDREMMERYVAHVKKTIALTEREMERTMHHPELSRLARMYRARFVGLLDQFERYGRNIVPALVSLADSGHVELLTCGATHGFLPALGNQEVQAAQIAVAVQTHRRLTGRPPRGIWLPECGYVPGIEQVLEREGLAYFLVDSHAFDEAQAAEAISVYAPLRVSQSNVFALARDPEAARQVWSSFVGYPGDADYREYYRDIGFDLEWGYIREFVHPDGIRVNTGIKYYRVTGQGEHKELYRPEWAERKCVQHAAHFVKARLEKLKEIRETSREGDEVESPPLIVAPYDAELFGHWWYEGPQWLEQVVMQLVDTELQLMTPSTYLCKFPQAQRAELSMSSWGRGGYADVWVNEANDWIYPHLHRLEERLVGLIRRKQREGMDDVTEQALRQMAREVLLAEASDWAFIMTMGTTVQYAMRRTREHLAQAQALAEMIEAGTVQQTYVQALEAARPIFPHLRLEDFVRRATGAVEKPRLRVLMLAWEFPPRTVGGLARHVYDLSRALVAQGVEVHVVTCHGEDTPEHEGVEGVDVHRVEAPDFAAGEDFVRWSMLLNVRLAAMGQRVLAAHGPFDVVHAHDWLVAESGQLLAEMGQCPLVATIHATEHGRNHGLYSELQRRIAHIEWKLAYEAREVIVCSQYMREEMRTVYGVPEWKQHVLPNGVDLMELERGLESSPAERAAQPEGATVFFVGRLVPEKGVQVLLEAAPAVLQACPDTRFCIAGKGPMRDTLGRMVEELGIAPAVEFLGFVTDEERNRWIKRADVAVFPSLYEPFGIVALEAMGLGTATVVSRTGGLAEIVEHGVDGWVVEPGDARSLGDTLISLLQHQEQREVVARNGQAKTAVAYGWSAIASGTVEVYEKAVREERSQTGAPETEKDPIRS
ncbi:MAG: 1,4-alpha-glucan branching protein domain-containing protein [Tumebacillaceae bacterium]